MEAATKLDDLFEKRIFFKNISNILLTEKFIQVELLVPFLTFEFTMKPDIDETIPQLSLIWETPFFVRLISQANLQ